MSADESVTLWLRQLEARDQDAAHLLWQRYYRELVELARATSSLRNRLLPPPTIPTSRYPSSIIAKNSIVPST